MNIESLYLLLLIGLIIILFYLFKKFHIAIIKKIPYININNKTKIRGNPFIDVDEIYVAIFERSLCGVYIHDFNGNFIDANNACLSMFGYDRKDIKNINFKNLLSKDQLLSAKESINEIMNCGKESISSQFKLKKRNGETIWIETIISVIYRRNKPYAIFGIVRDISLQIEVETNLKKKTIQLTERIKEITCLYGISNIIETNYNSPDKIYQGIVGLIPFGFQFPEIICAQLIINNKNYKTTKFKKTDLGLSSTIILNNEKIGSINVYYIEDKVNGDEVRFVKEERWLIAFISEQIKLLAERLNLDEILKRAKNEWETTFDAMSQWVCLLSKDGTVLRSNLQGEKFIGLDIKDIIGKNSNVLLKKVSDINIKEPLVNLLEIHKQEKFEIKDSENKKWYRLILDPIFKNNFELIGAVQIVEDISEKKLNEEIIYYAIEEERNRIGRDIHDGLGQKMTGLSLMLGTFKKKFENNNLKSDDFDNALKLIKNITTDLNVMSKGLYFAKVGSNNLLTLISTIINDIRKSFDVNFNISCDEKIIIDNDFMISNLYYIFNEAINNSIKHGCAKNIDIKVTIEEEFMKIIIKDDGNKPINVTSKKRGIGLETMEYRTKQLGGKFHAKQEENGFIVIGTFKI